MRIYPKCDSHNKRCHVQIVGTDGHVEACNKPTAGTISAYDDYDHITTYPACSACLAAAYEKGAYDDET